MNLSINSPTVGRFHEPTPPETERGALNDGKAGIIYFHAEFDVTGANPGFVIELPSVIGELSAISVVGYGAAAPAHTITITDQNGRSWTASVTGDSNNVLTTAITDIAGELTISCSGGGGTAGKRVRFAFLFRDNPVGSAGPGVASGGTAGQYLKKNSSTDFDTLWASFAIGTADIQNDVVTYAKIQNVSATDKVLGRSTAGAGDVEEIACTAAGRSIIAAASAAAQEALITPTTTQGDIIVRGAGADGRLAIGSSGHVLRVNSGATAPEWVAPFSPSLARDSILAWTTARETLAATGLILTSGTLYLSAVRVRTGITISKLGFFAITGATNPTNWWLAIYDESLNLLRNTADQTTTAIATGTAYEVNLTSSWSPGDVTVYFGLMIAATTPANIARSVSAAAMYGITPMLGATSTTGLTTTPPDPAGALTAISTLPWIYAK